MNLDKEVRSVQIKLYELRKGANLTQEELARKLGLSANQYGKKERGQQEFTQDEMFLLSKFFNKSISDIFLPRKSPKRELYF